MHLIYEGVLEAGRSARASVNKLKVMIDRI